MALVPASGWGIASPITSSEVELMETVDLMHSSNPPFLSDMQVLWFICTSQILARYKRIDSLKTVFLQSNFSAKVGGNSHKGLHRKPQTNRINTLAELPCCNLLVTPLNAINTPVYQPEPINVSALNALSYCPRLFYLQEVEGLRETTAEMYAGQRLHAEVAKEIGGEWQQWVLENAELGLRGRVDALKTQDGAVLLYEHKKGRSFRDDRDRPHAWENDRLQLLAYACLVEAELGLPITEARIRYHTDEVTVTVPLNATGREDVKVALHQARQLQTANQRPPITTHRHRCNGCSAASVCLPAEVRLAQGATEPVLRLFPEDDERMIIHVTEAGTRVGKSGDQIKITKRDGTVNHLPSRQIGQLVLHGYVQISTQTLYFCAERNIGLHYISGSGRYLGSFRPYEPNIQRRLRQYQALTQSDLCLALARQLVICRGQSQRKFLMRGKRNAAAASKPLNQAIDQMQRLLKQVPQAGSLPTLLGLEGNLAALYFGALPERLSETAATDFRFTSRNRRPPKDRFNAMLGFGYALLLKDVMNAILAVGLEPALGFYHQPHSKASPLALDLMEIFRVPLVDMPLMAAINRNQWDADADFDITSDRVWLSDSGRRKLIGLYEQRKEETWKHPVIQYSLTYRRLIELEVRLLEKEWTGEGGLFGQLVLR